jgi:hypothetical protein
VRPSGLDALLKEKLTGSGLEAYVEVIATISGETEKSWSKCFGSNPSNQYRGMEGILLEIEDIVSG